MQLHERWGELDTRTIHQRIEGYRSAVDLSAVTLADSSIFNVQLRSSDDAGGRAGGMRLVLSTTT